MRFVSGSWAAGVPRFCQLRPPSVLAQQSTSPATDPWLGWLKIVATIAPSGRSVRLGQAQHVVDCDDGFRDLAVAVQDARQ